MRKQKRTNSDSDGDFVIQNIFTPLIQLRYHYGEFCYRNESFQTYINKDALAEIFSHAIKGYESHRGEIAGALFGNVYRTFDNRITFVEVNSIVPARTISTYTSVTIPESEWSRINDILESDPRYRSRCTVVGWYHSHPGFGIFMSETDRHTHVSYFNLDWQIAIVVDPNNVDIGCFYGQNVQPCSIYKLPELDDDELLVARNLLVRQTKPQIHNVSKSVSLRTIVEKLVQIRENLEKNTSLESQVTGEFPGIIHIEKTAKRLGDIHTLQNELMNDVPQLDNELVTLKQLFDELQGKLVNFLEAEVKIAVPESSSSLLVAEINQILSNLADHLKDVLRTQTRIEYYIFEVKAYLDQSISLFSTLENTIKALQHEGMSTFQRQYLDALLNQFDISLQQLTEFEIEARAFNLDNQFRENNILRWIVEIIAVLLLSLLFGWIGISLHLKLLP